MKPPLWAFTGMGMVLSVAVSVAAVEVTEYIDTFNSAFQSGSTIGLIPDGWLYPAYGEPAFSGPETGLTREPHDGLDQSVLFALPVEQIASRCTGDQTYPCNGGGDDCWCGDGLYYLSFNGLDSLVSHPIDWTQPLTLTVDVQAYDSTVGGVWETLIDVWWYDSTVQSVEWGDNGVPNSQWTTATCTVDAGQVGITDGAIVMITHFEVAPTDTGECRSIFDSLRITYTPITEPEVCDNGLDDDLDGLVDCDDPDCAGVPGSGCCNNPVFDVDWDGDVDQEDFGFFQTCITGTGDLGGIFDSLSSDCRCLDVSSIPGEPDAIDQQDFVVFQLCATGPDPLSPVDPACDD